MPMPQSRIRRPQDPLGRPGWGQSDSSNDPLFLGPAGRVQEDRWLNRLRDMDRTFAEPARGVLPLYGNVLPDQNWDAFFGALREQATNVDYGGFGFGHQRSQFGPNAGVTQDLGADPMAGAEIGGDGRYTGRTKNSLGNLVDQGPFGRASWAGQRPAANPLPGLRRSMTSMGRM